MSSWKTTVAALLCCSLNLTAGEWWQPFPGLQWQYQLSDNGTISVVPHVEVYAIDLDTARNAIAALQRDAPGVKIVCYFSAGSWEGARDYWDRRRGKQSIQPKEWTGVRGSSMDNWPDERWLDIRSAAVRNIMAKRMKFAQKIGCSGVDPDNVNGYEQKTGFSITKQDQVRFNRWLARKAHMLGLGIGLKNAVGLVPRLRNAFDWFLNESCFTWQECRVYRRVPPQKAVLGVQYCDAAQVFGGPYRTSDPSCYCPKALARGWDFVIKEVSLGVPRMSCSAYCASHQCKSEAGACDADRKNVCQALA